MRRVDEIKNLNIQFPPRQSCCCPPKRVAFAFPEDFPLDITFGVIATDALLVENK